MNHKAINPTDSAPNYRLQLTAYSFILVFFMLLSACGYRFAGGGLPGHIKRVSVRMFENPTGETGIETLFANDLINELIRNSDLILTHDDEADAVFVGRIESLRFETISRGGTHTPFERQVKVSVSLELRGQDNLVIWSDKGLTESEAYPVMPDKLTTEHNRREAISEISKRLAEEVYDRLTNSDFPSPAPTD